MRKHFSASVHPRLVALSLGLVALCPLATAPASFAAGNGSKPPAVGTNCQPDGKINGGGSTFATRHCDRRVNQR